MTPDLRAVAHAQGGVFSRRQALDTGCSAREVRTRTRAGGDWAVVRHGFYTDRVRWDGAGEAGRYRLRVYAGALALTRPALVSHTSAAALLGLPLRPRWTMLVHLTRNSGSGGRTEGGVKHHPAGWQPDEVLTVGGLSSTGLARTAVDIGREFGFEDGVVAADAALRLGAVRADLNELISRMCNWPGATRARAAVRVADGGAANTGETLLRLLVLELGRGVPETQFVVEDGDRRAVADLRLRRHLFEFDGRIKYVGREQGGVAQGPPEDVVWAEKRREDWLRNHGGGFGVSRVVWSELFGSAREQTKRRLVTEIDQSDLRYGDLS